MINLPTGSAVDSGHEADGAITVTCLKCGKKLSIRDKRALRYHKLKVRCKACEHYFDVNLATRIIAVSVSKGGVGKTTTAVNLSAGLALAGYKVLLIDTDTQGQDGFVLGKKTKAGLPEFLMNKTDIQDTLVKARDNLLLLSGGRSLAGVKRIIDRKNFGGEWTLKEAMKPIEHLYDYIIVDTSPGWDPLTVNVLFYAKEILIPVSLRVMSLHALVEFMNSLSAIQKYRQDATSKYILPTFYDERIASTYNILKRLKKTYGKYVCNPIRYYSCITDAPASGKTIFEFAPAFSASDDYLELVRWVTGNPGFSE